MGRSSFKFLWWAPKDVCNVTECIIDVQGYFRVIQGRWFWYQLKAYMRLPISAHWSIVTLVLFAPFWIYGGWNVENRQFVPTVPSVNALARGDPSNFQMNLIFAKTRVFGLSDGEKIMTLALFILIQYQSMTDGRTDISAVAIPALA